MEPDTFKVVAKLRGAGLFGEAALARCEALTPEQPLLLEREPLNANDRNAVKVLTILTQPVGYIERGIAAVVAPMLDAGFVIMAKSLGSKRMLVWIDAPPPTETERVAEQVIADGIDDWRNLDRFDDERNLQEEEV